MRFSLISLAVLVLFFAFVFFSISNSSSRYWSDSVRTVYGLLFASSIVYAYDRGSTPAMAFGFTGMVIAYFASGSTFGFSLLLESMGLLDRSVMDNLAVVETLKHHLAALAASIAALIWKGLSLRERSRRLMAADD